MPNEEWLKMAKRSISDKDDPCADAIRCIIHYLETREVQEGYNKGIDHALKVLRDETKIQELGESMIPIYERIKKLKT